MPSKKIDGAKRADIYTVKNLDLIHVPPRGEHNQRRDKSFEDLSDLDSIVEKGVLMPLLVRKAPKGVDYKWILIAGERRLLRVKQAREEGHEINVPVRVLDKITEAEAFVLMAKENMERKDFNAIEEAEVVRKLKNWGWSYEKIAKSVGGGRGVSWVQQRFNLSGLNERGKVMVENGLPIDVATRIAVECEGDEKAMNKALDAAEKAGNKKARKAVMKRLGKTPKPGKKVVKRVIAALAEKGDAESDGAVLVTAALAFSQGEMSTEDFLKTLNGYAFLDKKLQTADLAPSK